MIRAQDAVEIWDVVLLSERTYVEMEEQKILPPNAVYYTIGLDDEVTVHHSDIKIWEELLDKWNSRPIERYANWLSEITEKKEKVGYFIT